MLHVAKCSWLRDQNGILAMKELICIENAEMPETFNDIQSE